MEALICKSTKNPIKGSLILTISNDEIVYGKLISETAKIKLPDTGEEKILSGSQHYFFQVQLIISTPKDSSSNFEDKLEAMENRIKALEGNN